MGGILLSFEGQHSQKPSYGYEALKAGGKILLAFIWYSIYYLWQLSRITVLGLGILLWFSLWKTKEPDVYGEFLFFFFFLLTCIVTVYEAPT